MLCIEVKYLQDGFNLYTHMRWRDAMRCYIGFDALYRGKIFARWVYPLHTHERHDAMRWSLVFEALLFCKIFARWVYIDTRMTSPRNPRFPICRRCIQTTFHARMSIFKSGISGSAHDSLHEMTRCDSLLSRVWCFVFCKIFARWVYKTHAWDDTMRCVALSQTPKSPI